jgi:RNA-directed DNA polymerase
VRFADDFLAIFARKTDAERVFAVLGKRLAKYGLELHPEKTRMVDFRAKKPTAAGGIAEPRMTFNFLGFVHVWGRSRKGNTVLRQQTAKDRFARALAAISERCRRSRHEPLADQHRQLSQMLTGHFGYFGISGNSKRLAALRYEARRIWRKWLSRRSNKSQVTWTVFARFERRFLLPYPRIVHRYTPLVSKAVQ